MSFKSLYEQPAKLDLGEGFFVLYRKCLTGAQRDHLRSTCMEMVPVEGRNAVRLESPDPFKTQVEQTLMSIVEWNLTDDGPDGKEVALPYGPHDWWNESVPSPLRVSWDGLPSAVQDRIVGAVLAAEVEVSGPAADAQFPDGGVGGDEGRVDETPDDSQSME